MHTHAYSTAQHVFLYNQHKVAMVVHLRLISCKHLPTWVQLPVSLPAREAADSSCSISLHDSLLGLHVLSSDLMTSKSKLSPWVLPEPMVGGVRERLQEWAQSELSADELSIHTSAAERNQIQTDMYQHLGFRNNRLSYLNLFKKCKLNADGSKRYIYRQHDELLIIRPITKSE